MKRFDLAIIGSGPGGYVAALYASRKKLKTCLIEEGATGGTCLNRGCISTKSLINSASLYTAVKNAGAFGVEVSGCRADLARMQDRKNEVVSRLRTGVETLLGAGSVELIRAHAVMAGPENIRAGNEDISAANIIIASGSRPAETAGLKFDRSAVLSSDDLLEMKSVPGSLAVIGGGVIGCEAASLFNALGSKVYIVEYADRLLPAQSREASKKLESSFRKRGIEIFTSASVESVDKARNVKLNLAGGRAISADIVLAATGRVPNTDSLGDLKALGISTENGRIVVDDSLKTSVKNIYAAGDCISGPMLAHKASYDGILAVDNILGEAKKRDYSAIPSVVWTEPEIASVGLSEEDARGKFKDVKVSKFPFLGSGKAYLLGKQDGFAKIIGDKNGAIMGAEIFGYGACELIAEAAIAKAAGMTVEKWALLVHAHPTLSEIWQEAARSFGGAPIHGI